MFLIVDIFLINGLLEGVSVLKKCCQVCFLLSLMVRLAVALNLLKSIKSIIFLVFLNVLYYDLFLLLFVVSHSLFHQNTSCFLSLKYNATLINWVAVVVIIFFFRFQCQFYNFIFWYVRFFYFMFN